MIFLFFSRSFRIASNCCSNVGDGSTAAAATAIAKAGIKSASNTKRLRVPTTQGKPLHRVRELLLSLYLSLSLSQSAFLRFYVDDIFSFVVPFFLSNCTFYSFIFFICFFFLCSEMPNYYR